MTSQQSLHAYGLIPQIEIELEFGIPPHTEIELIPKIGTPHLKITENGEIILSTLIEYLKDLGFPLSGSLVFYYSVTYGIWIYCGNDPISDKITVPYSDLVNGTHGTPMKLQINCKKLWNEINSDTCSATVSYRYKPAETRSIINMLPNRTKERKIGFVIDKVRKWRKLYQGYKSQKGEYVKLTLEQAASKVGVSKKSLDDYYLQLRYGNKYGFNFQEHREDKIGLLRKYVKKCKRLEKCLQEYQRGRLIPQGILNEIREPATCKCKNNRCCNILMGFQFDFEGRRVIKRLD